MQKGILNKSRILSLFVVLQLTSFLFYLNVNIVNVGEMGTALPLLVFYVGLSGVIFLALSLKRVLYIRVSLFIFLVFIIWVATRIIIDLGDMEYLKQITVATTGGILLFYLLGAFLGVSYQSALVQTGKNFFPKFLVFVFLCLMIWMLHNFSQRLHPQLFYLLEVNGAYQRPGNFLSISFIVVSFFYLTFVLQRIEIKVGALSVFFWFSIYTSSALMALAGSQLFGSNSATAVVLGVYLITLVMTLILPLKVIWLSYLKQDLALPWSKLFIKNLILMALLGLLIFIGLMMLIITVTGFDITSSRVLGFGSGTNNSLLTRIEILLETGTDQLSYAPFLGNINVAYLTTGNSGLTLHSFFPYVMANLGLVGLMIVLLLFTSVLMQLYRESRRGRYTGLYGYQANMIAVYSVFVFLYILFFANLATGVSWAVLWFVLGFFSKPIGFRERF